MDVKTVYFLKKYDVVNYFYFKCMAEMSFIKVKYNDFFTFGHHNFNSLKPFNRPSVFTATPTGQES